MLIMRFRDAILFFTEKTVDPASHLKRWILLPETPFEVASRAGAPSVPPSRQGQALPGAPLRSAALTWGGGWNLARTGRGRGRGAAADGRQDRRRQRKTHGRQKGRTWGPLRRLQQRGELVVRLLLLLLQAPERIKQHLA